MHTCGYWLEDDGRCLWCEGREALRRHMTDSNGKYSRREFETVWAVYAQEFLP